MSPQALMLLVALVVYVCFVVAMVMMFRAGRKSQAWPPVIGDCPDFWVDRGSHGSHCVNPHKIGKHPGPMDFTQPVFQGAAGLCHKFQWASAQGTPWDGITDRNPCR